MPIRNTTFSLVVIFVTLLAVLSPVGAADSPDITALVAQLNDDDKQKRKDAAEALAEIVDAKIPESVRKQIAVEKDFHVKLALQ